MSGQRLLKIIAPLAVGLLFLGFWEAVVRIENIPRYILPGPLLVAETLWTDGPSLLGSLLVTLRITGAALIAASLIGGAIALLFARSRVFEISLFPYAVILQVTPIVAIAPLIIIWVKDTFLSLLLCAWIVAFFPIVSNTTLGLNSADRNLVELFRLYGASRWQAPCRAKLPSGMAWSWTARFMRRGPAEIRATSTCTFWPRHGRLRLRDLPARPDWTWALPNATSAAW